MGEDILQEGQHQFDILDSRSSLEGYATNSPLWYKRLVLNAVEMLLPEAMVRIDGPSTLTSSVTEQPGGIGVWAEGGA